MHWKNKVNEENEKNKTKCRYRKKIVSHAAWKCSQRYLKQINKIVKSDFM